ncbi:MAG: hypothetical protein SFX73_29300 [Kofleriaceae bacterium]|nr:hypothetical protein [Kofleriaceae bacterium]
MSSVGTRAKVLEKVGAAIARRREDRTVDAPVLAEGTAQVAALGDTATTDSPRRRLWPWAAGTVAVALVGTFGYQAYSTRAERAELEAQYPIVATAADNVVLAREAARWSAGRDRLLANLAAFDAPAVGSMTGVGACPIAKATSSTSQLDEEAGAIDPDAAVTTRIILLPGEELDGLDVVARPEIDAMLAAAARRRFRTAEARAHVLDAMSGAFVVARLRTYAHGVAAGTAYAFDPATGALRCAGAFRTEADSSTTDLSKRTEDAILTSLRGVSVPL